MEQVIVASRPALVPVCKLVLFAEAALDHVPRDAFDQGEDQHHVVGGDCKFARVNSLFQGPAIVRIHPHHHELDPATERDDHDLAVVHCRIAEIVDPHGDQVQHPGQKPERVRTAERLAHFAIHERVEALPLRRSFLTRLDHRVVG